MRHLTLIAVALMTAATTLLPGTLRAQEQTDSARLAELERRLEILTRELEEMRLGSDVVEADPDTLIPGFAAGASKVYRINQGVSIGGYGEVLYENFAEEREDDVASGKQDQIDALRAIIYLGYKFNDRILFNSEIEVEHGSTSKSGSVSIEFAYLDYLFTDAVGLRAGVLLAPMGLVNELHEPPIFLGSERPVTENRIIPTTWRENGVGLFGNTDEFAWRVYAMNALDGAGYSDAGLRGGRQKAARALAEDIGVVGRVDYVGTLGLILGGSVYRGGSAHSRVVDGAEIDGTTTIWEAHADLKRNGWDLRALVAGSTVDEVEAMNELAGLGAGETIGESMLGWYVQAGYDVLRGTQSAHQLVPYFRWEQVDTQREVPTGFTADPSNELSVLSVGAAWKPIPQAIWKIDYQVHSNEADTGVNQFNVALGWLF